MRTLACLFALLAAAAPAAAEPPPDLVLVTLDTLRADALGFLGNETVATPVLDRLAARGRVFPEAHAHNVVTLPSHTNILTGLLPYQHGVRDNGGFVLPSTISTLATVLSAAGYATAAFVSAFPLDSQFGLDRGFDVYDDRLPVVSETTEFRLPERPGDETVARGRAWWDAHRGQRRFLWVHLYEPHAPYDTPEPFASRYRETPYLGEVALTDSLLAPLLVPFLDGAEAPALLVVTGDHGELLGEHGELTHSLFAYEGALAVPLVLWGPGIAAGRDARAASHVDVFVTVLDALGLDAGTPDGAAPDGLARSGRSLLAPPSEEGATTYFESLSANLNRGWAPLRGVIRDGYKLIVLPLSELFHLPSDRREERNLVTEERALARELLALLPRESQWPPSRGQVVSEETAEQLRSLGYLSDSAARPERYGSEDDPKNLVDLDRMMHMAVDSYSRGDLADAIELTRAMVKRRPSMRLGQSLLAQALLEAGSRDEALASMRAAREKGFASDHLQRQLGLTLAEIGRGEEALAVLRPLAAKDNVASVNTLALALSEAGRNDEAFDTFHKALRLDPDSGKAYEGIALVELRRGRWAAARDAAKKALERSDRLELAWNNLGVALRQLGDTAGAIDAWQRAVELKPELFDALYNLGTTALDADRPEVAYPALKQFVDGAPEERYAADLRRARVLVRRLERTREP